MVAGHVSIQHGLQGLIFHLQRLVPLVSHSIGIAARMIKYGDADVMLQVVQKWQLVH